MHIKVPFLAVLIISIIQITFYGIENNNYSKKNFDEIFNVSLNEITEIELIDKENHPHHVTDPDDIEKFYKYLNEFEYQRLRNDQTSFMPMQTLMITIHTEDDNYFLIPYEKEVLLDYKTYHVIGGEISDQALLQLFN